MEKKTGFVTYVTQQPKVIVLMLFDYRKCVLSIPAAI